MADKMINRLAPFMRRSEVLKSFFASVEPEFSSRDEAIADLQAQMSVTTATWGLLLYEKEYELKTDPSPLEERRAAVMAKMRATGKFTATMAHAIVSAYTDKVRRVTFTGRIKIHFNGLTNLNLITVAAALEDVKQAHIDVEYDMGNSSDLVISDKVTVSQRRYHKVSEFRVGMKPIKYQTEVIV
ncbi:putative phage tail protein [Brevibacillus composti]|uniref:DUF2313 domain-containing protein n=1 Tax=Brevibacillus composti TaxID=2796470 RepID=A0A7T5JPM1_9BACL|nr:putative phage tail protein [Brevibacillus composti]QQE75226.1 DUF2313 domain-containing protein [Brevibacillus composti]